MPDSNFPHQSKEADNHRLFHLWMPDIFGFTGGIQTYSAFLLKALQDLCPRATIQVFLKNDTRNLLPSEESVGHTSTTFNVAGHWPSRTRTAAFATQLVWEGIQQQPDLVFVGHLNFAPAAHLLKRLTDTPFWVMAYGIEAWSVQSATKRKALFASDKVLAISSYTRTRLANAAGLPLTAIDLLPNTFDSERYHIKAKPAYLLERYDLEVDQPVILTVARLAGYERYKGYDSVLHALPLIRERYPSVRYIIAGKGEDQPRIEQLICDLGLQNSVTLAGFVPDEELSDHYNLCDLFAMPSKGEGFGMVYLEALACGKPTLGGNIDGAVDALCDGELGVLIDPDDVDELAKVIVEVLSGSYTHPLLYHPEKLREKVVSTFGPEQFRYVLAGHLQSQFS